MKSRELTWDTLVTDYYGITRVERDESTGCLHWLGKLDKDGYAGRIKIGGVEYRPHRLAYELYFGEVPNIVDHLCHTNSSCVDASNCAHRRCIEPTHLESVTPAINIARGNTGIAKSSLTHCKHGHEFTPENTKRRSNGTRACRTCMRIRDKKSKAKLSGNVD